MDRGRRRLTPDFTSYVSGVGMNCVSCDICVHHLWFVFFFFPGVVPSSRVTGACPVTTDLIMRVNVRTTTTSWSCNFRGAGRRKTGFAVVSIVFEALQAVYAVLRTFRGCAAAAPVVLSPAMVESRLSISRRHGTNSRGRLRSHRTCHV